MTPALDPDPVLSVRHKSVPPAFWGRRASEAAGERHPLGAFSTPLLTLDRAASDHNTVTLMAWARERGLEIAPHGKTTMAPVLWRRLLDAGAWGLTVATPWQAQVARAAGVHRILIANEVVDPVGVAWLAAENDADAAPEIACWVDSVESARILAESAGTRPLDVLIELGAPGGRTGARGTEAALAVARAVLAAPRLRLRGVAGYEGSYGADRSAATVSRVRAYLVELRELAETLLGWDALVDPIVTAGGSAWFDLVADELGPLAESVGRRVSVVLRSGAFQAHDEVYYDGISPFADSGLEFRAALALWARVVSRPEPTLAILDAGKRDAPLDLGLPVVHGVPGAVVTALNDQHAYLRVPAESTLEVGDVVRLGISHPCTAFDKWRLIPEVDDADGDTPRVIGFIETYF
ncbi:alanine racemase [Lysinimonas soli]|uniref:Alanine racemase n=1 Tax=Lysinimonas soli TaxID=1074233 RepID=A0ABW0NTJ7_9MICO